MSLKDRWLPILVLAFAVTLAAAAQQSAPSAANAGTSAGKAKAGVNAALASAAKEFVAQGCDDSLWTHVYRSKRLAVVEKCISVTGTILNVKKEADGDDFIQLQLDAQYAKLLNSKNKSAQAGALIVEAICQNAVTQSNAVQACRDYHSAVEVPSGGSHVKVLGSYVLDSEAGSGWMEIHPVTSISPE